MARRTCTEETWFFGICMGLFLAVLFLGIFPGLVFAQKTPSVEEEQFVDMDPRNGELVSAPSDLPVMSWMIDLLLFSGGVYLGAKISLFLRRNQLVRCDQCRAFHDANHRSRPTRRIGGGS